MPTAIVLALLLATAGAGMIYAGARHQLLVAAPRPVLRWAGGAALLLALVVMIGWFGPATAVFAWATLAMLVWSVLPLAAAWRRGDR
jgi:hypothetical protein